MTHPLGDLVPVVWVEPVGVRPRVLHRVIGQEDGASGLIVVTAGGERLFAGGRTRFEIREWFGRSDRCPACVKAGPPDMGARDRVVRQLLLEGLAELPAQREMFP